MMRPAWHWTGLAVVLAAQTALAQEPAKPQITLPGLTQAGKVLLPNGWSLKPAGEQSELGDLPVAIAVHPPEPVRAILHAGYGTHEVVLVAEADGKVLGRNTFKESFAGLA